jgi:hypothetical protein
MRGLQKQPAIVWANSEGRLNLQRQFASHKQRTNMSLVNFERFVPIKPQATDADRRRARGCIDAGQDLGNKPGCNGVSSKAFRSFACSYSANISFA